MSRSITAVAAQQPSSCGKWRRAGSFDRHRRHPLMSTHVSRAYKLVAAIAACSRNAARRVGLDLESGIGVVIVRILPSCASERCSERPSGKAVSWLAGPRAFAHGRPTAGRKCSSLITQRGQSWPFALRA
jgi:hypothetical protein